VNAIRKEKLVNDVLAVDEKIFEAKFKKMKD
jgi:hypothetical protein